MSQCRQAGKQALRCIFGYTRWSRQGIKTCARAALLLLEPACVHMHDSRRPRGNTWRAANLNKVDVAGLKVPAGHYITPCQITQGITPARQTCCLGAATAAANAPRRGGNARKQLWKACACCVALTEHRTARQGTLMICVLTRCRRCKVVSHSPAQVIQASPRGLSTKQAAGPVQARDE